MNKAASGLDEEGLFLKSYEQMHIIRRMEDRILEWWKEGKVAGSTHLCQGQEAVCAGVCSSLKSDDYVLGTYRGHGESIAKGLSPNEVLAEILGKSTGCCKGKGGSMHLSKWEIGLVGTFSIVAGGLPCAVGLGLSCKLRGSQQVVVSFFGDGATNNGTFHESLNMAALWEVPVIFICANNLYGEYTPLPKSTKMTNLAHRADSYSMQNVSCDGNDYFAVRAATLDAVERARRGQGPMLIECKTYRRGGHSARDKATYRPQGEVEEWLKRDPLVIMREELFSKGVLDEKTDQEITTRTINTIEKASRDALSAPYPALATAFEGVYCKS